MSPFVPLRSVTVCHSFISFEMSIRERTLQTSKDTLGLGIVAFFRLPRSIFIEALEHDTNGTHSEPAPVTSPSQLWFDLVCPKKWSNKKCQLSLSQFKDSTLKVPWSWPDRDAPLCGASCQSHDQPTSVWLKWPQE